MNSTWKITRRPRALHDLDEALPVLEIHVTHWPTLALPEQTKHLARLVRARLPQFCNGKNQHRARARELGLAQELGGFRRNLSMQFLRLLRESAQDLPDPGVLVLVQPRQQFEP